MSRCLMAVVNASSQLVLRCQQLPRLMFDGFTSCCDCCAPSLHQCYCVCVKALVLITCCPCTCFLLLCRSYRLCRRFFKTTQSGTVEDGNISQRSSTSVNLHSGDTKIQFDDNDGAKILPGSDVGELTLQLIDERRGRQHESDDRDNKNYMFYTNKLKSQPRGDFIDEIHKKWWRKYDLLESHHGFIQWLFPLPEPGVNSSAQTLKSHEIDKIRASAEAQERLLKSYKMMLDFYGIELVSSDTGEVRRTDGWKERFENLNWNTHNNLRISRILRSLGLLGLGHLQLPLLKFFVREIIVERTLTSCRRSCFDYWLMTLDGNNHDLIMEHIRELEQEARQQDVQTKNITGSHKLTEDKLEEVHVEVDVKEQNLKASSVIEDQRVSDAKNPTVDTKDPKASSVVKVHEEQRVREVHNLEEGDVADRMASSVVQNPVEGAARDEKASSLVQNPAEGDMVDLTASRVAKVQKVQTFSDVHNKSLEINMTDSAEQSLKSRTETCEETVNSQEQIQ